MRKCCSTVTGRGTFLAVLCLLLGSTSTTDANSNFRGPGVSSRFLVTRTGAIQGPPNNPNKPPAGGWRIKGTTVPIPASLQLVPTSAQPGQTVRIDLNLSGIAGESGVPITYHSNSNASFTDLPRDKSVEGGYATDHVYVTVAGNAAPGNINIYATDAAGNQKQVTLTILAKRN
jgi:hypothetical protein